jgi:hypothetical protein
VLNEANLQRLYNHPVRSVDVGDRTLYYPA